MNKARLIALIAAALVLAGCNKKTDAPQPAKPTAPSGPAATIVATINGQTISLEELDKAIRPQLLDLEKQRSAKEHEIRQQALEEMIARRLIEAEAKKLGTTDQELVKQEVASKITPPTEAEMRQFYDQNKQQIGRPYDDVRGQVGQFILGQKRQRALVEYVSRLRSGANVQLTLPPPEMPKVEVAATGPSRGPASAPVTIVVFSEFQCPFCAKVKPALDQVLGTYGDKVRIVFRDYPLPFHDNAKKAAEAGHCADEQGKFWEMHDKMFADQAKLAVADLKASAREVGIDGTKFDECLDSGRMAAKVQENLDAGQQAGVDGTPAFFINGRAVSGAVPFEQLKALIDRELSRS